MIVSAKEYAALINRTPSSIAKKLKTMTNKKLPGAKKVEKYGNTWRITLPENFDAKDAENKFAKYLVSNSN